MSSSRPNNKSQGSGNKLFKALKFLRKSLATDPANKNGLMVTPTAVGGSEDQEQLISELKTADNHRKLVILLQLKKSIELHSITSILETWIPVREVLYNIDHNANSYSNYDKLRERVVELLLTCIEYDDLNQLSIVIRYVSDVLYFCKVSPTSVDPNINSFLNCFCKLIDSKLLGDFHNLVLHVSQEVNGDTSSILSSEGSFLNRNVELMCSRSVSQFIIDVLSCEVLLQTNTHIQTLTTFVNKLNSVLTDDRAYVFDEKVMPLALSAMFKLAVMAPDFEDANGLIAEIFNFINTALGCSYIPVSVFPKTVILLCYFYDKEARFKPAIEGIFRSLIKSDNCTDLTFEVIIKLISGYNYKKLLSFESDSMDESYVDDHLVTYKDVFVRTVASLNNDTVVDTSSLDRMEKSTSTLEKYFPAKTQNNISITKSEGQLRHMNSTNFQIDTLNGLLKLIKFYIEENDFEVFSAEEKEFIFEEDSFKFQRLINAFYDRLEDEIVTSETPSVVNFSARRDILKFINFLLSDVKIIYNIPDELLFYGDLMEGEDFPIDYSSENTTASQDEVSGTPDLKCSSIFDLLHKVYVTSFEGNKFLESFPNLFKNQKSFKENFQLLQSLNDDESLFECESIFVDVIEEYRKIIDLVQGYIIHNNVGSKLELADLSTFFVDKVTLFSPKNWKFMLLTIEESSAYLSEDSFRFSEFVRELMDDIFNHKSRGALFFMNDLQDINKTKLEVLKTIKSVHDYHYDFHGNNEKLWPLINCLFGFNNGQGSFFATETDPKIIDFLLECITSTMKIAKAEYFDEIIFDNILSDLSEFENEKFTESTFDGFVATFPLQTFFKISKLLVSFFIESTSYNNSRISNLEINESIQIRDAPKKSKSLYQALLMVFRFCCAGFHKYHNESSFTESALGAELFKIFFIIFDCFARLRVTEEGFFYFDSSVREYRILTEQQSANSSSNIHNALSSPFVKIILEITNASENHLKFLPKKSFLIPSNSVRLKDSQNLITFEEDEDDDEDDEVVKNIEELQINEYFDLVLKLLDGYSGTPIILFTWYSIILQLSNVPLFNNSKPQIRELRTKACQQIRMKSLDISEMNKGDKIVLQKTIIRLLLRIVIHSQQYTMQEQHEIVDVLVAGLNNFELVGILCIHTLTVCCYQIPRSITKSIQAILAKFQQHISNPDATPHILEFLLSLSHLTKLISDFVLADFKSIFAMAFRFIKTSNELQENDTNIESIKFARYLSSLSYSVISTWFLKIKMESRKKLAPFIIEFLIEISKQKTTSNGNEEIDSMCLILIEFIQRFTYTNLDLRFKLIKEEVDINETFYSVSRWIIGLSVISIKTHKANGESIVTIRRPTGTTKFEVRPHRSMVPLQNLIDYGEGTEGLFTENYLFLQLVKHLYPKDKEELPLLIPDDSKIQRAIKLFDNKPLIKTYKAGIIYIGPGQNDEKEILSNTIGSKNYHNFLSNIGILIRIKKNTTYYPAGLDSETDGEFAYCWDDKISQLTFLTITMMPFKSIQSINYRKAHIGNSFVNIYFDESGIPFNFNIIPSQFTFINIVITPVSLLSENYFIPFDNGNEEKAEKFYLVKTYLKDGLPKIFSTCHVKPVSLKNLPNFVKNLSMVCNQFSEIWNQNNQIENSWFDRYKEILKIKKLVENFYNNNGSNNSEKKKSVNNSNNPFFAAFNNLDNNLGKNDNNDLVKSFDFTQYT